MPEKDVSVLLRDIKGALQNSPTVKVASMSGYSDHRKMVTSGAHYAVIKQTTFKGHEVIYVMDVLTEEDLEYYW